MAILVNEETGIIVQGITGRQGSFHTKLMIDYGTKIVAGVTPGKGGTSVYGIPVYDTVMEALDQKDAKASIVFVPASSSMEAVLEAIENGLKLIVVITEHIPIHDIMKMKEASIKHGARILGPNSPGIIVPGRCKVGIMPVQVFIPGSVGVVSRSGTLTYEIVHHLTQKQIGQSTCIGIGGDPITGTSFIDVLQLFEDDIDTDSIVLVGEIGGYMEEETAEFIERRITKPVVAYIAGKVAPHGRRMGHAGAIIERERGTAESKIKTFNRFNIPVANTPKEVAELTRI